jgi:hypothetical protein
MSKLIMYEGPESIILAGFAKVATDVREVAWAEEHVTNDPDIKWILGNFVQAEIPNDNGHIFPLEDLKATHASLLNKPMNMLHHESHIVGHYVGTQMMFPMAEGGSGNVLEPYVEVVGAFYKYYFPQEFAEVEKAYKDGALGLSMECVPSALRCIEEGCGVEVAYAGRASDTYCAHLQQPGAKRHLIKPHFTGGALIVPPAIPAWRQADVKNLSLALAGAEMLREDLAAATDHLNPINWTKMMDVILQQAETSLK